MKGPVADRRTHVENDDISIGANATGQRERLILERRSPSRRGHTRGSRGGISKRATFELATISAPRRAKLHRAAPSPALRPRGAACASARVESKRRRPSSERPSRRRLQRDSVVVVNALL